VTETDRDTFLAKTFVFRQLYLAAQTVLCLRGSVAGISPRRPGLDPAPFLVIFVVCEVAVGPTLHTHSPVSTTLYNFLN